MSQLLYKIITHEANWLNGAEIMQDKVGKYIAAGWSPQGGSAVHSDPNASPSKIIWAQAMTKVIEQP